MIRKLYNRLYKYPLFSLLRFLTRNDNGVKPDKWVVALYRLLFPLRWYAEDVSEIRTDFRRGVYIIGNHAIPFQFFDHISNQVSNNDYFRFIKTDSSDFVHVTVFTDLVMVGLTNEEAEYLTKLIKKNNFDMAASGLYTTSKGFKTPEVMLNAIILSKIEDSQKEQ